VRRVSFPWRMAAAVAAILACAIPGFGQEPMGIVRFAPLSQWESVLDGIEDVSQDGAVGKVLAPARIGLAMARGGGIDDARPWGIACLPLDDNAGVVLIVPVQDLDRLHQTARPAIEELEELDGGVYQVKMGGRTLYCLPGDGWLFVSEKEGAVRQVPGDPSPWLDALDGSALIAVRANLGAVPRAQAEMVKEWFHEQASEAMRQGPHESDAMYELRKAIAQRLDATIWDILGQTQTCDFSIRWDRDAGKVVISTVWKAQEGSDLAAWMQKQEGLVSPLPVLKTHPGAVFYLGWNYLFPAPSQVELAAAGEVIRGELYGQLDQNLSDADEAEFAKGMVDDLLRLLGQAIESGQSEGAFALLTRDENLYLVAAGRVPDPYGVEEFAEKVVEAIQAKAPSNAVSVEPFAFANEDSQIHLLTLTLPEKAQRNPAVERMFGTKIEVAMLVSDEYVAWVIGKDAVPMLRDLAEQAEAHGPQTSPAVEMQVGIEKAVAYALQLAPEHVKEKLSAVLDLLSETSDEEQIRVTVDCHGSDVRKTVEIDQAVFQIPQAVQ